MLVVLLVGLEIAAGTIGFINREEIVNNFVNKVCVQVEMYVCMHYTYMYVYLMKHTQSSPVIFNKQKKRAAVAYRWDSNP